MPFYLMSTYHVRYPIVAYGSFTTHLKAPRLLKAHQVSGYGYTRISKLSVQYLFCRVRLQARHSKDKSLFLVIDGDNDSNWLQIAECYHCRP